MKIEILIGLLACITALDHHSIILAQDGPILLRLSRGENEADHGEREPMQNGERIIASIA